MDPINRQAHAVLVAKGELATVLTQLFQHPSLSHWNLTVAQSLEHAHFHAQLLTCDLLLIDVASVAGDLPVLGWLTAQPRVPVLLLADPDATLLQHALAHEIHFWLPPSLLLEQPSLLAEALHHAQRRIARARCNGSQRTEDHERPACNGDLAELLWNALPIEGRTGWLSQRHVLERLHEEVARANRHNLPLTLILTEFRVDIGDNATNTDPVQMHEVEHSLRTWIAERVLHGKRRSDVAGQYGPRGFLLLLPHTSLEGAYQRCRRLRWDIEQTPPELLGPYCLRASFGVASYSSQFRTPKHLLRVAEEHLADVLASGSPPPSDVNALAHGKAFSAPPGCTS